MAINFPFSPTVGQVYVYRGEPYQYDGVKWIKFGGVGELGAAVSGTAPASPVNGTLWFDTDTRLLYSYVSATSTWTQVDGNNPGDVVTSFDATMLTGYVELNGATISGGVATYPVVAARYAWMVSGGNLVLPDARGRFLRSWAHGSGNDPDRASRSARVGGTTGDNPGTYQVHELASHLHPVPGVLVALTPGGTNFRVLGGGSDNINTSNTGGNETRPSNIYVTYQMKMG